MPPPRNYVLPAALIDELLPAITEVEEWQVVIAVVRLANATTANPPELPVSLLMADPTLQASLARTETLSTRDRIERGMALAISHSILVESNGNLRPNFLKPLATQSEIDGSETVYLRYEKTIGPLSPLITERLAKAVELYGEANVHRGIREMIVQNKRSIRYLEAVLRNWELRGSIEQTSLSEREPERLEADIGGLDRGLEIKDYQAGRHLRRARNLSMPDL